MIEGQKQAYLNEFKGNLFEYLVGKELARLYSKERKYLEGLPSEAHRFLSHYEKELRVLDPQLPTQLSELAKSFCENLIKDHRFQLRGVEEVILVGKYKNFEENFDFEEADIVIKTEEEVIPLSLKLVKTQSFVNTKSAGVRTFFKKYFDDSNLQDSVNKEIDVIYETMARGLYSNHELDYEGDFERWKSLGLPDLPGQLEIPDKEVLHRSYKEISALFYKHLKTLSLGEDFHERLQPLLGKSHQSMVQIHCFHSGTTTYDYVDYHLEIPMLNEMWAIGEEEPDHASIHFFSSNKIFQVRIKPMNKFTVPSFKVNCSVKFLRS